MLAYVQISKSASKPNVKFHKLYRDCYQNQSQLSVEFFDKHFQPGQIVGSFLMPGYIPHQKYKTLSDEPSTKYIDHYLNGRKRDVHCYPIIATFLFHKKVQGISNGNVAAMKINPKLLSKLNVAMGPQNLKFCKQKIEYFQTSRNLKITKRIIILKKEHAINTFMGIKSAEFRFTKLGDSMLPEIKSKTDLEKISRFKRYIKRKKQNFSKLAQYMQKK